ncbi:hypothetical protein H6F88_31710 [Oculatella sp. FACHB-28]|uniref:hypothetical protein n=1 Tax=Oculatella sp. FACHB-28 TaxID=2692845 RepID=UPI001683CC69|nr:hypothetical protein [Oculatella sp. FACHB-28]MBD2060510.1 hypothetical protein [Oculatella sp. FACHB-28]
MANVIRVSLEGVDNLSNVISGSIIKANLLGSAINSAMSVATAAVRQFTTSIGDSIVAQQQNISIAGDFARLTGESFTEAGQFIDDFAERMSAAAGSLPGATADYVNLGKGISDNLVPAFKDLNGVFDPEQFQEYLDAISRDGAFRSISSGVDVGNAGLGISKYLGGASIAELSQIKFFEANPAVLNFIQEEAKALGKELEDLSTRERADVLRRALAVPDEVIKASQNTISGLVEGFKSTLFDPTSGLFGLMRRVNGGTALEAITSAIGSLIGEDGLLTAIGETLDVLGISFGDPMVALRNTALTFTARVKYVTGILNDISEGFGEAGNGLDWDSITNDIFYLFTQLFDVGQLNSILNGSGSKVAELVNNLLDGIASLDWGAIGAMSGELLADVLNEGLDFLNGFDFTVLLPLTLRVLDNLLTGVGSFLANVDWGSLLMVGIKVIALNAVYGIASAIAVSIAGAVLSLGAIPAAIIAGVAALVAVIVANWDAIVSFFQTQWGNLTNAVSGGFQALVEFVKNGWDSLTETVGSHWESIQSSVTGFFSRVQSFFTRAVNLIPGLGSQEVQTSPVPNAANGLNVGGLLGAIARESSRMPSGSELVVANSSEAILNQAQQASLARLISYGRQSSNGGLSIGNITIHTQATDAEGIADEIISMISRKYVQFQRSQLTATAV